MLNLQWCKGGFSVDVNERRRAYLTRPCYLRNDSALVSAAAV